MSDEILRILQAAIGREASVGGQECHVVEVLAEGPCLVLEHLQGGGVVQSDLHGNPLRRVPDSFTVPLTGRGGVELHPLLRELLSEDERGRLEALLGLSPP